MSPLMNGQPCGMVHLAGFKNLTVRAGDDFGKVRIEYRGSPEDLVAAGIVPPQFLVLGNKGDRTRRIDPSGDRWYVTGWWVGHNCGQPRRRFLVIVTKSTDVARRMPGVIEALAARVARDREDGDGYVMEQPEPALPGGVSIANCTMGSLPMATSTQ